CTKMTVQATAATSKRASQTTIFVCRDGAAGVASILPAGVVNLPSPIKGSEVAIIFATVVIPIQAKDMEMAASGMSQSQTGISRVKRIINIKRLIGFDRAGDTFACLIQHTRNRNRAAHTI